MRMSVSEVAEEGMHMFTAILRDITQEQQQQQKFAAYDLLQLEKSKLAALLDTTVRQNCLWCRCYIDVYRFELITCRRSIFCLKLHFTGGGVHRH